MAKHFDAVHDMLAQGASQGGETVQMLGRLGYGPAVSRSPRWPLASRFIEPKQVPVEAYRPATSGLRENQ